MVSLYPANFYLIRNANWDIEESVTVIKWPLLCYCTQLPQLYAVGMYLYNVRLFCSLFCQVERMDREKGSWLACGRSKENTFLARGLIEGHEYRDGQRDVT